MAKKEIALQDILDRYRNSSENAPKQAYGAILNMLDKALQNLPKKEKIKVVAETIKSGECQEPRELVYMLDFIWENMSNGENGWLEHTPNKIKYRKFLMNLYKEIKQLQTEKNTHFSNYFGSHRLDVPRFEILRRIIRGWHQYSEDSHRGTEILCIDAEKCFCFVCNAYEFASEKNQKKILELFRSQLEKGYWHSFDEWITKAPKQIAIVLLHRRVNKEKDFVREIDLLLGFNIKARTKEAVELVKKKLEEIKSIDSAATSFIESLTDDECKGIKRISTEICSETVCKIKIVFPEKTEEEKKASLNYLDTVKKIQKARNRFLKELEETFSFPVEVKGPDLNFAE